MRDFLIFPRTVLGHGRALSIAAPPLVMPFGPEDLADGEFSCLPGLAARLISRARELRRVKRRHGGVLMMPWHGCREAVRYLYWKGRVLIQEEDAGTPWGAALFLALEGADAQRVGIWRKGGAR